MYNPGAYSAIPLLTSANNYSPMSPGLTGGSGVSLTNAASGGLPTDPSNPALFWVGLVAALVVLRLAWEYSPMGNKGKE